MVSFNYEEGEGYVFSNEGDMHDDNEAYIRGFEDVEEVEECAECGGAVRESAVQKKIKDEHYNFCSGECADDYIESTI